MAAPALLALAPAILAEVSKWAERFFPDPVAREKAMQDFQLQLLTFAQSANLAQIEVNKAEAANGVGGWRWGMGWLCVASLGYSWLLRPMLLWAIAIFNPDLVPPPPIDVEAQFAAITGMLGLAGVRAYDLVKGSRR